MDKAKAIELLGGTVTEAAAAIGITPSAVTQWPEVLPPRLVDRVHAAIARRTLPAEALGLTPPPEPAKVGAPAAGTGSRTTGWSGCD